MLGLSERVAKFVKKYANLREEISGAVGAFMADVEAGVFPDEQHSYSGGQVYGTAAAPVSAEVASR
jgi:3-methyl-2-oxobutanoate hydroxymethyltransferase